MIAAIKNHSPVFDTRGFKQPNKEQKVQVSDTTMRNHGFAAG
jgi:hypothetical protein